MCVLAVVLSSSQTVWLRVYPILPKPTFLWVLIINPNVDFIGTLQKSRFWRVEVVTQSVSLDPDA